MCIWQGHGKSPGTAVNGCTELIVNGHSRAETSRQAELVTTATAAGRGTDSWIMTTDNAQDATRGNNNNYICHRPGHSLTRAQSGHALGSGFVFSHANSPRLMNAVGFSVRKASTRETAQNIDPLMPRIARFTMPHADVVDSLTPLYP